MPFALRLLFATALILVFLAAWIVLPAPNRPLLALSVGAPEVSSWLLVGALIVGGLALAIGGPATAGPYDRRSHTTVVGAAFRRPERRRWN